MSRSVGDSLIIVDGNVLQTAAKHISALDRGFALGDGVFETIRVADGRPVWLDAHLARLRQSASVLRFGVPVADDTLRGWVEQVVAENGLADAAVRLTVSRGVPAQRGLLPPPIVTPTIVVQASPFHAVPPEKVAAGYGAVISTIRRNESSPASRIKSCNYLDNVLARVAAQRAGADEAILLNMAGELACTSTANIHIVANDRVLTPALDCGVLGGITREMVRETCDHLGLGWEEGRLGLGELLAADEAFLTNSLIGVVPLTAVNGRLVGGGRYRETALRLRLEVEARIAGGR